MKKLNSKILKGAVLLLFSAFLILPTQSFGQDSVRMLLPMGVRVDSLDQLAEKYRLRLAHYENFWRSLIPTHVEMQYAGSIGVASVGLGWHYGHHKRVWETDVLFGYLPSFHTRHKKLTMTVKQSYIPFRIPICSNVSFEPLSTGLFFNTIFDDQFWASQPDKYPKKYYGFSTKIRTNIFIGERLRYEIPSSRRKHARSISAYYEISTNDLYVVSYATNKYLSLIDILSLGLGVKFEFF